jgi:hypothetical protein
MFLSLTYAKRWRHYHRCSVGQPEGAAGVGGSSEDEPAQTREVVLLGAGFSHAVNSLFPLTEELGKLALEAAEVRESEHPARGTRFEAWLSRLAEDQPYRSVEANLDARKLFMKMSAAIARVLGEREREALQGTTPAWLDDLLTVWHTRRSTVITFNYDNVVECAVDGHCLTDRSGGVPRHVTSHDILDRLPPLPPSILSEELPLDAPLPPRRPLLLPGSDRVAETFRLLKLHGSLSWFWSPDDTTGVTLQRWRSRGSFGQPRLADEDERRRALPGRVPFVVPPTSMKSSYLTNLVSRELWSRAREALAGAQRLIVVGYSVPPEDQVASGMLAEALRGRDIEVIVVDPCARAVEARLMDLRVAPATRRFDELSCVEDFTTWYRDDQARSVVRRLRDWARSVRLEGLQGQVHVEWGKCQRASCMRSAPYGHLGPVDTSAIRTSKSGADVIVPLLSRGSVHQVDQQQVPTLLRHLADDGVQRLLAEISDNKTFPVLDFKLSPRRPDFDPAATDPSRHLTLVPSGHPR